MAPDPSPPYVEEIERWWQGRLAGLTGPEGWLSLAGLAWLGEGDNPIGSGSSNAVVLPAGKAPEHAGTITVDGGRAILRAGPGAGITHEGRPVREVALQDDADGAPTVLRLGSLSFHVISREGRLAVRVRDPEAPSRRSFRGIQRFPVDPRWRVDARFEAHDPVERVLVQNVLGTGETQVVPGAVRFRIGRTDHGLETFREAGTTDLFIVFGDQTNEDDTYPGGRYLYAPAPDGRGMTVVDFNKAYNPPCAFTPYATCVLPLPQNRLPVRIEAGEKRYRHPDVADHGPGR
jgi:uncharacterized protein (DUF1684 family)